MNVFPLYEDLPLHIACNFGSYFEVIHLLMSAYPDSIKQVNQYGDLPLHVACRKKKSSLELIHLLVRSYYDSFKKNNDDGDLALHLACYFEAFFKVIQFLIREYPDSVK